MSDIEKLKLNQTMRKEAVKAAIQFKFKKRVENYRKQIHTAITNYALTRKENKQAIEAYNDLNDDFKRLVRLFSNIYIVDKDDNNIMIEMSVGMKYLTYSVSDNEIYHPFIDSRDKARAYGQTTKLTFSQPLITSTFKFEDKLPSSINKALIVRNELMKEIEQFSHDAYHALSQVKTLKQVREYIPALEQFIPIPEKEFTKMVPFSFFNKVNDSVNGVK